MRSRSVKNTVKAGVGAFMAISGTVGAVHCFSEAGEHPPATATTEFMDSFEEVADDIGRGIALGGVAFMGVLAYVYAAGDELENAFEQRRHQRTQEEALLRFIMASGIEAPEKMMDLLREEETERLIYRGGYATV